MPTLRSTKPTIRPHMIAGNPITNIQTVATTSGGDSTPDTSIVGSKRMLWTTLLDPRIPNQKNTRNIDRPRNPATANQILGGMPLVSIHSKAPSAGTEPSRRRAALASICKLRTPLEPGPVRGPTEPVSRIGSHQYFLMAARAATNHPFQSPAEASLRKSFTRPAFRSRDSSVNVNLTTSGL